MINPAWIKARAADVRRADLIDPKLYERYNVKRGLRNADGTGVLVGLSTIGNVHGYVMDEGEKISVDISASDLCEILKAQFNGGYTVTNAVTGDSITWESTGYVNKIAIQYVIKEAE